MDIESSNKMHQYIPNKKDPRVLLSFKDRYKEDLLLSFPSNLNSQQLKALDKKEWEKLLLKKIFIKNGKVKQNLILNPILKNLQIKQLFLNLNFQKYMLKM